MQPQVLVQSYSINSVEPEISVAPVKRLEFAMADWLWFKV
jgi:hypothetical protein